MSQQMLNRTARKAIRIAATSGRRIIPKHVHTVSSFDHGAMRMFAPAIEEEHLIYPESSTIPMRTRFAVYLNPTPETTKCKICGDDVLLEPFLQQDLKARHSVCYKCRTERSSVCSNCGHATTTVTLVTMRDGKAGAVCNECRGSYFSPCDMCGAVVYDGLHAAVNDMSVCPACATEYKKKNHWCGRCGTWIPTESKMLAADASHVCMQCFSTELNARMTAGKSMKKCVGYCSTGGKVFFTTQPAKILFLGAEVELTNGKTPEAYDNIDPTFAQELATFPEVARKSDATVSRGHELATEAMELGYHQQFFGWNRLMELHVKHKFDGHDSPQAGYHIHGSLAFFGERATTARNLKLGKLLYMLDRPEWREQWKKFSRRNNKAVRESGETDPWGYCKWYDINWANYTFIDGFAKALDENQTYRNRVLNFYNHHSSPVKLAKTVEWRGLKSHTNHQVILAGLEMMDLLCRIAESKITETGVRAMTWKHLCKKVPNSSPNLVWYLQSKHLWER